MAPKRTTLIIVAELQTPVLIVGGGVTGLSGALFLAWHDVPCLLVERHPDLLIHPRARGLTPRTVELFRQVGLERAIMAAAYAGPDFVWAPIKADTLNDAEYGVPDEPQEDDGSAASPSPFGPIDQDKLELLIRDEARRLGAELLFNTELIAFDQDSDGVTAVVRDRVTGHENTVNASYLVAADGVNSPIRTRLGIEVHGPGPLFTTMTAIVEADLTPALRGRSVTMAYLERPQPFTIMMPHDDVGRRWVFGTGFDPNQQSIADFTDDRVADMVRAAAGLPDLEVTLRPQIRGTDLKVLDFPIVAQIAASYRSGRVFLVGDAAHAWPPTGGLGANTGIQDVHNLAWKLAAVIRGEAGARLLDTYGEERHPTGMLTMGQAMARFGTRMGPEDGPQVLDYGAVAMGYQYRSPAISAAAAGTDLPPLPPAELAGQPGTRAPHVVVTRDGREISTIDLYGRRFVLLTGADGAAWLHAAAEQEVPVDAFRLGVELPPISAADAHGIGPDEALLVRPDGFVAWRGDTGPDGPQRRLADVLHAVLSAPVPAE